MDPRTRLGVLGAIYGLIVGIVVSALEAFGQNQFLLVGLGLVPLCMAGGIAFALNPAAGSYGRRAR